MARALSSSSGMHSTIKDKVSGHGPNVFLERGFIIILRLQNSTIWILKWRRGNKAWSSQSREAHAEAGSALRLRGQLQVAVKWQCTSEWTEVFLTVVTISIVF